MPYIAACVDVIRTVFWDRSNKTLLSHDICLIVITFVNLEHDELFVMDTLNLKTTDSNVRKIHIRCYSIIVFIYSGNLININISLFHLFLLFNP